MGAIFPLGKLALVGVPIQGFADSAVYLTSNFWDGCPRASVPIGSLWDSKTILGIPPKPPALSPHMRRGPDRVHRNSLPRCHRSWPG
jgi:hypothetical protein